MYFLARPTPRCRFSAKDLSVHPCCHVQSDDHHRHPELGQAGEAKDLLCDKLSDGASLNAHLGFQAGVATRRGAAYKCAKGVLTLPEVDTLFLLVQRDKSQRYPSGIAKRFPVMLEKRNPRQLVEGHWFHAKTVTKKQNTTRNTL